MLNNSKKLYKKDIKKLFYDSQVQKFSERYIEYRKKWEGSVDSKNILDFPMYLNIESTFLCNLECPTCLHGMHTKDKKALVKSELIESIGSQSMPDDIFEEVIRQAKENNLPSIGLNWVGEPLLVKNITDRIKLCRDAGIMDIIMSTNGALLTEKISEEIIDNGLTHLLFSIDAADEETYNIVRPGGNYNQTIENIKKFHEIRKAKKSITPITRISFVTSKLNQHQIEKVVEKYKDLVDFVELQGIDITLTEISHLVPDKAEQVEFSCDEPFKKLNIGADGSIYPCCHVEPREKMRLGNIKEDKIKDVFTSNKLINQIRNDIEADDYTIDQCKKCQKVFFRIVR